jgi:hypothetical protein
MQWGKKVVDEQQEAPPRLNADGAGEQRRYIQLPPRRKQLWGDERERPRSFALHSLVFTDNLLSYVFFLL